MHIQNETRFEADFFASAFLGLILFTMFSYE